MAIIDKVVSHWKLDEASGNALDAHSTNDLTETSGTIGSAAGKIGTARDFELSDTQWFEHADNAALSTGDVDCGGSAWIKLESASPDLYVVMSKWTGTTATSEYLLYIGADQKLHLAVYSGASDSDEVVANTFGAMATATWYFVQWWHDAANNIIGVSVNDVDDTKSWTHGLNDTATKFALGSDGAFNFYFDGLIDEATFFKPFLDDAQRATMYGGGAGLAYPFSEGGGGDNRRRRVLIGSAA